MRTVNLYHREADADPFIHLGAVSIPAGSVDYEGACRRFGIRQGEECLVVVGGYGYTFTLKAEG